jgi:hypothetical protein
MASAFYGILMPPMDPLAFALVVLLVAFGLWAAIRRLLAKPPEALTPMDRLVGSLLLGKFFARLHAKRHPPKP